MNLEFSQQIFKKYSSFKFHERPSSRSPVVPCWRTDMNKLIVAFLQFCKCAKQLLQSSYTAIRLQLCCNAWRPLSEYEYLHVSGWTYLRLQYSIITLKTTVWLGSSCAVEVHWNFCPSFLKGLWKKVIIVGKWQLWEKLYVRFIGTTINEQYSWENNAMGSNQKRFHCSLDRSASSWLKATINCLIVTAGGTLYSRLSSV